MTTTATRPPIVVGVDGSPTSEPALAWAVDEASSRGLALRLVSTWSTDYTVESLGLSQHMVIEHCRAILDEAKAKVAERAPELEVSTAAHIGAAAPALIGESRSADTVVVGSRGLRAIAAALLGATSLEVAAHANCPTVVVREGSSSASADGPVVVGVDGSAVSEEAIAYAFEHADQRRLNLEVVHSWQAEYVAGVISGLAAEDSRRTLSEEEHAVTLEAIAGWRAKYPDVVVATVVRTGHPVDTLVARSMEASLVVVGTHGRGPLGSAFLGSVSHELLRRAHCPVAVVRPRAAHGSR